MRIDKQINIVLNSILFILSIFFFYNGYWMLVKAGYEKLYKPIIWINFGFWLLFTINTN